MNIILQCNNLTKSYEQANQTITVLDDINLEVKQGQAIAIIGVSGAGKSTLLNMLGVLDTPTSGQIVLNGKDVSTLNDDERSQLRNKTLGFVYQFHHLLPEFTALENVCMPLLIANSNINDAKDKAVKLLKEVGLEMRVNHKPSELSGGERQRVAIARALVNSPKLVLLDEPTGNLDFQNAQRVQEMILQMSENLSTSFIVVTHDNEFAKKMNMTWKLSNGKINF